MPHRAWVFTKRGPPSAVLSLTSTHPDPVFPPQVPLPKAAPQPEEWLLVRVSAAALNTGSLFYMHLLPTFARAATAVPEMDFAGVVEDVWAPDAGQPRRFDKGDRVLGFLPVGFTWPTGQGALQERVAVPARYVVRRPPGVGAVEASGLLLAGCTAWQLLADAKVKQGDRVLVYGASGGIGTLAVQMAKEIVGPAGQVVAVCSGKNLELVKGLGADEAIDYLARKSLPAELARRYESQPFDAIVDCIGIQPVYVRCASYLRPEDIYASVGVKNRKWSVGAFASAVWTMQLNALWPRSPWLGGTGRTWHGTSMMAASVELMEKVVGLLGEGKVKVVVDSVWSMEEALEGYKVMESLRARGKIVVQIREEE